MDFDMEWAYCTSLMDEETKKPEGEQLAAAQRGKLEQVCTSCPLWESLNV